MQQLFLKLSSAYSSATKQTRESTRTNRNWILDTFPCYHNSEATVCGPSTLFRKQRVIFTPLTAIGNLEFYQLIGGHYGKLNRVERWKEPENDGKNESESWHKVADSRSKRWRAVIDSCIPHYLR